MYVCFKVIKINTVTQLLLLVVFALTLNRLSMAVSCIALASFVVMLAYLKAHRFFNMLKRLKWVFLAIGLVYGLNTPGEYLQIRTWTLSFTHEGLWLGLAQTIRIISMLALLMCVMTINSRTQLISGLYYLLAPLSRLGCDVQRFAVRLWLTLHYVESQPEHHRHSDFFADFEQRLSDIFADTQTEVVEIVIERPLFGLADYLCISAMLALPIWAIWQGAA